MRITLGMIAVVITGVFIGLFVMPDYIFFPLIGGAAFLTGLGIFSKSAAWSIGLMIVGTAAFASGIKCMRDHCAAQDKEAETAEEEVRRRMGRIHEDD